MTTMTPTERIIAPILTRTYGKGSMVTSLVTYLGKRIDEYDADPRHKRENRERMIMLCCWDWMTGGSTAEAVARHIEDTLALEEIDRP